MNDEKTHEELYEAALAAISALYSAEVGKERTVESLYELIGEIKTMLETLE